jgi:hypothetical protein
MHRGGLFLQIPAPSSSCHRLVTWWENRCGQSDHPLLVPPSRLRPSGRTPNHPTRPIQSQTETTPIGAPFPPPTAPRKLSITSRKRISALSCQHRGAGLRFHPRRRGNPAAARIKRFGEVRAAPRPWCGNLEPPGNRGRQGRSGDRTGILRDRRAVTERRVSRLARSFRRRGGRDLRIAHLPGASAIGKELHAELGPRPDTGWARVPRGLRLRPRLPRDFLVLWVPSSRGISFGCAWRDPLCNAG